MVTLRQLIEEIIAEEPTTVEQLIAGFIDICGDVGSRTIAAQQCQDYMMKYPQIGREFWTSKKFKDIHDFNKFIANLQVKARQVTATVKKKVEKEFRDAKREWDMEQIELEVQRQTIEWDKKLAKMTAK